jgi:hypothetical protein
VRVCVCVCLFAPVFGMGAGEVGDMRCFRPFVGVFGHRAQKTMYRVSKVASRAGDADRSIHNW